MLGIEVFSEELGTPLSLVNVYGPFLNRVPFWHSLFQSTLVNGDSVVMGGDLNFSLGHSEIWGPHAQV